MDVNVSPEKLRDFATEVSAFSKNIHTECAELQDALRRLEMNSDEANMVETRRIVKNISDTIDGAEPKLLKLKNKIEHYADYVEYLRKIARRK